MVVLLYIWDHAELGFCNHEENYRPKNFLCNSLAAALVAHGHAKKCLQ